MIITKLEKKEFDEFFALMQEAFPPEEYRPREKQLSILDDPAYEATVLKEAGSISAFIAVWKLNGFVFAEHLAVSSALRGQGRGSQFMAEYLKRLSSPLVLEVEDMPDSIAQRRIGFYKKLGFILTDICYDQPNFQNSERTIPLRIMYHPNGYTVDENNIKTEIFTKVYKKNPREI